MITILIIIFGLLILIDVDMAVAGAGILFILAAVGTILVTVGYVLFYTLIVLL